MLTSMFTVRGCLSPLGDSLVEVTDGPVAEDSIWQSMRLWQFRRLVLEGFLFP